MYHAQKSTYESSNNTLYLKLCFFTTLCFVLTILTYLYGIYAEAQEETPSYSETLLGDEQTPLILLGREILSSNDMLECPTLQDIDEMLQDARTSEQIPNNIFENIQKQPNIDREQSYLLGFPLTALNKPLILGWSVIRFSYPNASSENSHNRMFSQYRLKNMSMDTQARLTNLNERCFLDFVYCGREDRCITDDQGQIPSHIKIPVLGISQKHQAVIIDSTELGNQLNTLILLYQIENHSSSFIPPLFNIHESQSTIVDFSQSTLIFDIVKTLVPYSQYRFTFPYFFVPPPQVTSRWFIKFGLETENNFVSRRPTQGVEYVTTQPILYDDVLIYRQNISPESPVHFYVKNFPDEYKEVVQQTFQYWNFIHIFLKGYPAFSYTFIQGDYDGQKEIILGDIRYNVMEWSNNRYQSNIGATVYQADQRTGEIFSTIISINGAYLLDEYPRWFRYTEMIRANEVIEDDTFLNNPAIQGLFFIISQVNIDTFPPFPPHLQIHLLAPQEETAESYIFNFLTYSIAHEIGHAFGLGHNPKANIFMDNTTFYSVMDFLDLGGNHNYNLNYDTTLNNYDKMAIAYSYSGIPPEYTDRSCSENEAMNIHTSMDEQKNKSPECTQNDATHLPLENYVNKLRMVLDLLMKRKDERSFPYLILNPSVDLLIKGLIYSIASYHFSANSQYDQLQTVLIKGRRPNNPQEVKDLVEGYLTNILCDSNVPDILLDESIQNSNNIFDKYLYENAEQIAMHFYHTIFDFTDIDMITCRPNKNLTLSRYKDDQNP